VKLGELGEAGAIARIARAAARRGAPGVVLGIGDDAALLRPLPGRDLAVSSDALVEGVHFRWRSESPRHVGRRALVASLSDLAAMGARPLGCLLSLAAPPGLELRRFDGLVAGLLQEAGSHGCPLVGGNLSRASQTSLTLTVLGSVGRGRALTRRGAQAGDRLCVTGTLGGMALAVVRAERAGAPLRFLPTPRLRAGRALARLPGIGACIDVSDGLEVDLEHLLEGTELAPELEPGALPVPRGFGAACRRAGVDPERLARGGGEDYELLFTVRPGGPSAALLSRRLGVPVSAIGRLVPGSRRGRPRPRGWRHFGAR
jgi:thiamine-monophosphate kinase